MEVGLVRDVVINGVTVHNHLMAVSQPELLNLPEIICYLRRRTEILNYLLCDG